MDELRNNKERLTKVEEDRRRLDKQARHSHERMIRLEEKCRDLKNLLAND